MIIAIILLAVLALALAILSFILYCRWRKTFVAFRLSIKMLELIQEDYKIPDWQMEGNYIKSAGQKIREEIKNADHKRRRKTS